MATFGLDQTFIKKMKGSLKPASILTDEASDFFILPQLHVIYEKCWDKLLDSVCSKLKNGTYGPKPPIEMEIPKASRVSSRSISVIGPNYFRPGSVLLPEDRIVYHFLAQEASEAAEKKIDRAKVFSHLPLADAGAGFVSSHAQWSLLKQKLEKEIKSEKYTLAFKSDIAQYFTSVNQHELVNQLEHQRYPTELKSFLEKFLSSLTVDRSSRGLLQGLYGSDVLGNGYLIAIDDMIVERGHPHFRYVDDIYILFKDSENFRDFFADFVKKLRDYDMSLNEAKTFITSPAKMLREETELDREIEAAKAEAREKLTDYEKIEAESGPYGHSTVIEIIENTPDEDEVELVATIDIFDKLDDFKGEERDRAELFCLSFFRKAASPVALDYVLKKWSRSADKAREYALYLSKFSKDPTHSKKIMETFEEAAGHMIDYQWAWAAAVIRMLPQVSASFLTTIFAIQKDGSKNAVIRSLLTYSVCKFGSASQKKEVRDKYNDSPLLVQLAIIHASQYFTSGERSSLMKTAEAHGDLQALICEAVKASKGRS